MQACSHETWYQIMMEEIKATHLVHKVTFDNSQWFGIDYNMNLYKSCNHQCIYCDSMSECYQIEDFGRVRVKENAVGIVYQDLKSKKQKGVVGIGAMSDTYNPFEKELQITRRALEVIEELGFGISLETKSALVTRDIDLFQKIAKKHSTIIKLTITAADDELARKIERNVNSSSERFQAIKELSDAGVFCGILMTPILPFITDTESNIINIVRLAHENGAKFIYAMFGVTLRDRQREYFYNRLDEYFKGLTSKYIETYGNNYFCDSPNSKELRKIFVEECKKYGILYRMEDIIRAYKKSNECKQLTLFDS
jgi:DNA repair photolyase